MNLINEAIIEAKMLREEAKKMAEQEVLEKYAPRIKKSIEKILNEEDENIEDSMSDIDLGAMGGDDEEVSLDGLDDGDGLGGLDMSGGGGGGGLSGVDTEEQPAAYGAQSEVDFAGGEDVADYDTTNIPDGFGDGLNTGDDEQIELEFPDIMSALTSDDDEEIGSDVFDTSDTEDHMDMAEEVVGLDESSMAAGAVEGAVGSQRPSKKKKNAGKYPNINDVDDPDSEELYYITDEDVAKMSDEYISELLDVDYEPVASGKMAAGTNDSEENTETLKRKIKSLENDKDELVNENIRVLKRMMSIEKNTELLENKLVAAARHLKESNKKNAKLFYTNCVLNNVSLNERQKRTFAAKILESETVEQAKVLYETCINMASTGTTAKGDSRDSLNESLRDTATRSSTKRRLQESENIDVNFKKMWQKKAGIIIDNGENDDE